MSRPAKGRFVLSDLLCYQRLRPFIRSGPGRPQGDTMMNRTTTATAGMLVILPTLALAHVGVGATSGMGAGFAHPLTGLDHILAMVGVGMIAAYMGGRALWLLPVSFVAMMAVGGLSGVAGMPLPYF